MHVSSTTPLSEAMAVVAIDQLITHQQSSSKRSQEKKREEIWSLHSELGPLSPIKAPLGGELRPLGSLIEEGLPRDSRPEHLKLKERRVGGREREISRTICEKGGSVVLFPFLLPIPLILFSIMNYRAPLVA